MRFLSLFLLLATAVLAQPESKPVKKDRPVSEGLKQEQQVAEEKKQDAVFHLVEQEKLKPTRWDQGSTTITNESRLDLFRPYLANKLKGGVYVGIGSTQNFTLAAWARSDYIYLVDFTRIVVLSNRVHMLFIEKSPTREKYLELWQKKNLKDALFLLKQHYKKDYKTYRWAFLTSRKFFARHYPRMLRMSKKYKYPIYYSDDAIYDYTRRLVLKKRVLALRGDLRGTTTLKSIAATVKKMNSFISVLYLSNAEDYRILFSYPAGFKRNMMALPAETNSMVLRTSSVYRRKRNWAPGSHYLTPRGFHYLVQPLHQFQKWLALPRLTSGRMFDLAGRAQQKRGFTDLNRPPRQKKKR